MRLLRLVGAVLLAASGVEHLQLELAGGYGSVPVIGPLFLLQAATAFVLALAVLASPFPLVALSGGLFALATLGGYLLSLSVGLFGFHEVVTGAGIAAGLVEIAAFSALALAAALPGRESLPPALRPLPPLPAAVLVVPVSLAALIAFSVELSQASPVGGVSATAAVRPVIAIEVAGYGRVLATPTHRSLYVLSTERGGRIVCRGGCLSIWPPLLVKGSVTGLRGAAGVRGKLGLVARNGSKQATDNGFPLYTYAGDAGPAGSAGEGIVSFGGTWYLARASATAPAATEVRGR